MRRANLSDPAACGLKGWLGLFPNVLPHNGGPSINGFDRLVLRVNRMWGMGRNRDHFSLFDAEDPVIYPKKQFAF
jgi:hypothetical protein